jgi:hypothetical protein
VPHVADIPKAFIKMIATFNGVGKGLKHQGTATKTTLLNLFQIK